MSIDSKPIGEVIQNYNDAKESLQHAVKDVIEKAKSIGLDPKSAEDVRVSIAYLSGYRKGPNRV